MATQVLMPQLGLTMNEGLLTEWAKKEGDAVHVGDVLFSVENDKATLPVEAQADGILANICVQAMETVPVGTVVAVILAGGEKAEDSPTKGAGTSAPKETGAATPEPSEPAAAVPVDAPRATEPEKPASAPIARSADGFVLASPVARRLAQESSLDLSSLKGSGPDGAVLERDLPASARAAAERATATPTPAAADASELITLSRIGQIGAERMAKSWSEIPQFTLYIEACAEELIQIQEKSKQTDTSVSITVILAGLLAKAVRNFPKVNASWAGNGTVRTYRDVNVGIAMDTPEGLVVPVLRDCANKGFKTLSREMKALAEKGKNRSLSSEDITGGTITLSNLGMFGVTRFNAIVNPPQAVIIAVGNTTRKPVEGPMGNILFRRYIELSITSDHRVVDGAYAGKFLAAYKELIENPTYALL